jgi:hypothetical protein
VLVLDVNGALPEFARAIKGVAAAAGQIEILETPSAKTRARCFLDSPPTRRRAPESAASGDSASRLRQAIARISFPPCAATCAFAVPAAAEASLATQMRSEDAS